MKCMVKSGHQNAGRCHIRTAQTAVFQWTTQIFKDHDIACRTVILRAVLYGPEKWSVVLREGRRLRVFEKRVLRKKFGPTRDEESGEWRRLRKEELCDL
jgi:hypothetical protein